MIPKRKYPRPPPQPPLQRPHLSPASKASAASATREGEIRAPRLATDSREAALEWLKWGLGGELPPIFSEPPALKGALYSLTEVHSTSPERKAVCGGLEALGIHVDKVERVYNPVLWREYRAELHTLMECKADAPETIQAVEKSDEKTAKRLAALPEQGEDWRPYSPHQSVLYHCTKSSVATVLEEGLDARLGQGGLVGKGIYFSDCPLKSMQYDRTRTNGSQGTLFVFSVILGDCLDVTDHPNKAGLVREPRKSQGQMRTDMDATFDSVTASPDGRFNEFVLYTKARCYPLYLVHYSSAQQKGRAPSSHGRLNMLPRFVWTKDGKRTLSEGTPWPNSLEGLLNTMGVSPPRTSQEASRNPVDAGVAEYQKEYNAGLVDDDRALELALQLSRADERCARNSAENDDEDDLHTAIENSMVALHNAGDRMSREVRDDREGRRSHSAAMKGRVVVLDDDDDDGQSITGVGPADASGDRGGAANQGVPTENQVIVVGDSDVGAGGLDDDLSDWQEQQDLKIAMELSRQEAETHAKALKLAGVESTGSVAVDGQGWQEVPAGILEYGGPSLASNTHRGKRRMSQRSTGGDRVRRRRGVAPSVVPGSSPSEGLDDANSECPICAGAVGPLRSLECCKGRLCYSCGDRIASRGITMSGQSWQWLKCPFCSHMDKTPVGTCPDGTMDVRTEKGSLPGHSGCGTIIIVYTVPSCTRQGHRISGTTRECYLPDSQEGQHVLAGLKIAWEHRLVFRVGESVTTGARNTVCWAGIHHKTSRTGGAYGFPDAGYLARVRDELRGSGVVIPRKY